MVGKQPLFNRLEVLDRGDPMSQYLFILCMERLSKNIEREVSLGRWNPLKISRNGPKLSHLFSADNLTLFATADTINYLNINTILQ